MSVDISRLAAHLAPEQQRAIAKEYRRRAEHDTTAFLLCFFAGILGAHRFYLRQFGSGLLHLLLPVVAAVIVIGGLALDVKPAALAIVAIPLLLIGLVWAVIDLFRLDDEVYQRNLKLAEDLIARAMLADQSVERQARATLERVEHDAAAATSGAAGTAALASRQPETEAEYHATTVTQVSESVPGQAQFGGPPETTEQTESVPIAGYGPQVQETITTRHEQTPTSVTDSVETIKTYEPELPAVAAPASTEPLAAAQAEPDDTLPAAPSPAAPSAVAPPVWEAPAETAAPPTWEAPIESNEAAAATWPSPHFPASGDAPAPPARKLDVTDLGGDVTEAPVADVGMENTAPQRVVLPEDLARARAIAESSAPDTASGAAQSHPYGDPSASIADDALLFLVPEAATQAAEPAPAPTWDVPTQHSPPPVSVQDDAATAPAGPPVWPTPEAASTPESQPAPEQAIDRTQALPLAGVAAVGAGMGAAELSGDPNAQPLAPSDPPSPHKLRRVRVTRQIVIDGKVVEETSAEELIEPDADPEPVRARLQEELRHKAEARERELRGQG